MDITITVEDVVLTAELNDTPTAQKVAGILPLKTPFDTWGDEIYFEIPILAELDDSAREVVALGDLGYWPTGRAFCIFFGPTPMSRGGRIVPASAVNIIGRVKDDVRRLKSVMTAEKIHIKPAG
jgi:hypothetical protein